MRQGRGRIASVIGMGVALGAATGVGLAGCVAAVDLSRDVFVGDWQCGDEAVGLTGRTITRADGEEKIAWIETGKNADYDLFTTRGARYSIFDQRRNSLTLHAHASDETRACTRIS